MSPPHHQTEPLRQQLIRSLAEDGPVRAVAYDPDARAFEAFGFGHSGTSLLDPVRATTLDGALAEVTEREHGLDRGSRIAVREIGQGCDLLHIYAVRRTNTVTSWRTAYDNPYGRTALAYKCRLEHICTVDFRVIAGEFTYFNENPSLMDFRRREHDARQAQRPEGARG